ncbi:hypothetical protein [Endozoicomonas acroporae]|uniref:hypothetical protein n=1 Tax=Endozoicomonas acroporae TaxID=1701104 RepID=UPI003D78FF00
MPSNNTTVTLTEEEQKRSNEMFDNFRDELLKRQLSNTESYDRAILTLSSSGLAVSVAFLKLIFPASGTDHLYFMQVSWLFFVLTIICSLVAYWVGNKAIDEQLIIAEDYYVHNQEDAFERPNIYSTFNDKLNVCTGGFFIIAIISMMLFVTLSLHTGDSPVSDSKTNTSQVVQVNDSASVPRMQQRVSSGGNVETNSARIPRMQAKPGTTSTQSQPTQQQPSSNGGKSGE